MLRAFPAAVTVDAGGTLVLHVATDMPAYRVRLERWTDHAELVREYGPFAGFDAAPGAPDVPWNWPAIAVSLPRDAMPGAYVARFTAGRDTPGLAFDDRSPDGRSGLALFVVRAPSAARILVNLPLFTYHAYNVAHVDGTLGENEGACLYSGQRAVTLRRPGGGTGGHPWDEVNADVYDRTTPRQTFAHWDLHALRWFAREGVGVDVCTDLDVHRAEVDLNRYALLCTFGHDEYWTRAKRRNVESFLDRGGNVAFFGGNTCWFRVCFDERTQTIIRDGKWSDDEPEDALTGLSYRRGGGKWIGARPATGYRVEHAEHPFLRDAGAHDGELIGDRAALIGYECDGVDAAHAPPGLAVLGRASFEEWNVSDGSGELAAGGHAAMVTFARAAGTVFNAGTVDWARVLAADDRVGAITRSVVRRLSRVAGG